MHLTSPRISPRLLQFLPSEQLAEFEQSHNTIVVLWPDLSIAYVNPAWIRFAVENDGEPAISSSWSVGARILDAIAPPIRSFFESHYRRCLQERQVWNYEYECSSADRFRVFHLSAVPAHNAEVLIAIHTPRIDFACVRDESPPVVADYLQIDGSVCQCCDCRKFQRAEPKAQWDWVPFWIRCRPQHVRQSLCPSCCSFYGGDRERQTRRLLPEDRAREGMPQ